MNFDSQQVFAAIQEIATTSSKKEKATLLSYYLKESGPLMLKVLQYAYDPFLTYNIKKLPNAIRLVRSVPYHSFDGATFALLDRLANRELTGNEARNVLAIELGRLNDESAELLRRIILKDMKAGFSESSINKAHKGAIPEFPYNRCALPKDTNLEAWPWENGIFSQEKADGMFVNINLDETGCWMTTRQGTPIPLEPFEVLVEMIEDRFARHTQTHGEILVVDPDGKILAREVGNGILNSVLKGGSFDEGFYPIIKVWDQIAMKHVQPKGKSDIPYDKRLAYLYQQVKDGTLISLIETRIVRSLKEAYAHYKEMLIAGKEGTIVKRREMIWKDTGSSGNKDQIKLKLEAPCELEIIGFVPGDQNGKHAKTFGSLLCRSSCGKLEVAVSGLKDDLRLQIHNERDTWLGKIITVVSNAIMYSDNLEKKPHSLFLPRFYEDRLDKSEADSFERIEWQFENAVEAVA